MRKIFAVMLAAAMVLGTTACGSSSGQTASEQAGTAQTEEGTSTEDRIADSAGEPAIEETASNILIAYFSRVGNINFDENIDAVTSASVNMNGSDVSGNAQLLAETVQEVTDGELFFIETVEKYPAEYRETTDQAKTEQNDDVRPELSSHVENMDVYDTIILIYPVWWGKLPPPVVTFLEEYDFSGKTILPLCTHEGSQMGQSESGIEAVCPDVQLLSGLAVRGSSAGSAQAEVEEWLRDFGILE